MADHGDVQPDDHEPPDPEGRGNHGLEGYGAVADEAARLALSQVAPTGASIGDRTRVVWQLAGTVSAPAGPYMADGAGGWIFMGPTASAGGLQFTAGAAKTANYTAVNGDLVKADPSGGAFQVDAPATPSENDSFGVKNVTGSTVPITIDFNGETVDGGSATRLVNAAFQWRVFKYNGTEWSEVGG